MLNIKNIETVCAGCFTQLESVGVCPVCGHADAPAGIPSHLLRPRTILGGKYLLGKALGQGGFGITYIGFDLNLELKVAIKEYYPTGFVTRETTATNTVRPSDGSKGDFFNKGRKRFLSEAMNLAKFSALPGIVAAKEYFQENGTAYIVTEFIHGRTLNAYIEEMGGKLSIAHVFELMEPIMISLSRVHAEGIIHRDISPDNIMITHQGRMKLIDFGAAREFGDSGNRSMSVFLKPGYAPEEQYRSRGVQGPWTDVYALCATIYKAATGVVPLDAVSRLWEDALQSMSALGVEISPEWDAALTKGMAVQQNDRYQSISALYADVYGRQISQAADTQAEVPQVISPTNPDAQADSNKKTTCAGAVILAAAIVLTILFFSADGDLAIMLESYPLLVLACIGGAGAMIWRCQKQDPGKTTAPVPAPTPLPAPVPVPTPVPVPASAAVSMLCTRGHFAGALFPVSKSLAIGRDPGRCQIIFPKDSGGISSLHCEVSIYPEGVVLTDKGSTYGTFLRDGRRLNADERVPLAPGDIFYLADRQTEFQIL